ncbi:ThiF family adenylyltransferase [Brachybacterium sp. J153]|uniref:ThiF family adenylyltransferase n=1 Tax=Brachybacterium sp. J153 TaxID=3116488 RepID=UPI002E796117|nr:ThiF family adenylyltransferase [Brachybacterium sp. J153]MEE1619029.1 ThiF family adenylyltransferase [Brachybacterium sp. J153]
MHGVSDAGDGVGGERYTRQIRLPELGSAGQARLGTARVAVIGAGGLGAPILTYLAAAGIGRITVFDPDVVELTNLHRQVLFTAADVGRPKALVAAERLAALNPEVAVRPVTSAVTPQNALEQLGGHDLVLDGSDNFPTRYLVSDACEILDLPLVWGSILAFSGQVSVFWGEGGRGVTYRDVHPVPPRPGEVPSCAEAGVLGMLCGTIGATMAMEAVKVLTGIGEPLLGRLALYDALRARWDELPLARDPQRAPVTAIEDLEATCGLPGPGVAEAGTGRFGEPGAGESGGSRAVPEVTAAELPALMADGVRVVDLRESTELGVGRIAGAEHLPLGRLLDEAGADLDGAVLYCASGRRSASAVRFLAARGITARSLSGGFAGLGGSEVPVEPAEPGEQAEQPSR